MGKLNLLAFAAVLLSSATQASTSLGTFRNTHYYLVDEKDYARFTSNDVLLDRNGVVLAQVSNQFRRALDIEGSGKLLDGRVVNFHGVIQGRIRYFSVRYPDGLGVGDCPLVPFRTIAVDSKKIPLGSLVRVEETVGMKLPDGSVHDGLWKAEDIGGAIKQDRIDLFVGIEDGGKALSAHGIRHLQPLTISLVQSAPGDSCVNREYQP